MNTTLQKQVILLLGMPGAGKTTSGKILAEHLNVPFLSTGDVLRFGRSSGQISPHVDPATGFLKLELQRTPQMYASGLILDFSPVQTHASHWLEEMLNECAFSIHRVIHVHAKAEDAMKRFVLRGHRSNDPLDESPHQIFLRRVATEFNTCSLPLITQAREANKLYVLDNTGDLEECRKQIREIANAIRQQDS